MKKLQQFLIVGSILLIVSGCAKAPQSITPALQKAHASEIKSEKVLSSSYAKMTIPAWAQGKVIREVKVKPGVKVVALTFDDGPWPKYTHEVLQVLKKYKVKATFFEVGHELSKRPDVARDVIADGHVIGNHSWDHPAKPGKAAVAQVKNTDNEIAKKLTVTTHLFRPPYGLLKNGMAAQAESEKHAVILWSVDSEDWHRPSAAHMAQTVMREVYPGGIVLMHDGGGNRTHTVAALSLVIPALKKRGYKFVTIPELLEMRYVPLKQVKKPQAKKVKKK